MQNITEEYHYLCSTPSTALVSRALEVLSPNVATGPDFRSKHVHMSLKNVHFNLQNG